MSALDREAMRQELGLVLLGVIIGGGESSARVLRTLSKHAYTGLCCDGVAQEYKAGDEQQVMTAWMKRYGVSPLRDVVQTLIDEVNERGRANERQRLLDRVTKLVMSQGGYTRSWSAQLQRLLKEVDDEAQEQANDEHGSEGGVRANEYGVHDSVAW